MQTPPGLWDPAGFAANGGGEAVKRRLIAELKHGRVGMLAAIGRAVPESYRFDGYLVPSEDTQISLWK